MQMSRKRKTTEPEAQSGAASGHGGIQDQIRALLEGQPFGVLCTQGEGQPYGSVVALAYDEGLSRLAFATPENTFKYRQLCACDRVAVVIDDRSQFPDDARRASAITAVGSAERVEAGADLAQWQARLAERHPDLADFFRAKGTALFCVNVEQHKLITRFQEVHVWEPQNQ
jgi:nitroimidazol reductase NimA-like FMN-containing flavoprotein (pyridoxamine 5'-phosphate oxidase superfamily)